MTLTQKAIEFEAGSDFRSLLAADSIVFVRDPKVKSCPTKSCPRGVFLARARYTANAKQVAACVKKILDMGLPREEEEGPRAQPPLLSKLPKRTGTGKRTPQNSHRPCKEKKVTLSDDPGWVISVQLAQISELERKSTHEEATAYFVVTLMRPTPFDQISRLQDSQSSQP